jgi:hypothetical protein
MNFTFNLLLSLGDPNDFKEINGDRNMHCELKNQTLVAAELARQAGFSETYKALLSIARQLAFTDSHRASPDERSSVG